MMTKMIIPILIFSCLAEARILVISDVDDTIKISHVLDKSDALSKADKTENLFRGMNVLYKQIQVALPGAQFSYLTNAPEFIMKHNHQKFLSDNMFPAGNLLLREKLTEKEHKIKTLRKLLENSNDIELLILIGDNGERDPAIYNAITQEFPQIQQITFIRQAYYTLKDLNDDLGTPLQKGQIGFVSPVEISLELLQRGILSSEQVDIIENSFVVDTMNSQDHEDNFSRDGILSFPRWIDCREYQIPQGLVQRTTTLAEQLVGRIQTRCSTPAIDD